MTHTHLFSHYGGGGFTVLPRSPMLAGMALPNSMAVMYNRTISVRFLKKLKLDSGRKVVA